MYAITVIYVADKAVSAEHVDTDTEKVMDCQEEWNRAYEICEKEIFGCNKGITGGYNNVYECARGLVSERCGGNKIEY